MVLRFKVGNMSNLISLGLICLFTFCIDIVVNCFLNLISEAEYEKEVKWKVRKEYGQE